MPGFVRQPLGAMKLSILIPVYNERTVVERSISLVLAAPVPENIERELVIVDDCSTDGTYTILARLADSHPEIHLYQHPYNQGKGAAVRTAIQYASGDFSLIQDADLEYDSSEYPILLKPLLDGRADAVFGSRYLAGEQKRVLRLIPGLERAELIRYGQIHRNTFICAPAVLTETLQMRADPRVFFAGQISGVEGYIEAMATGFMAGIHAAELARGRTPQAPPRGTAMGSLTNYIANAEAKNFQPMNITFALLPPLEEADRKRLRRKADRHHHQVELALKDFEGWRMRYVSKAAASARI